MRNKESASWDLGTGSHRVLGEVDGTVQVDAGVRERAVREKGKRREGGYWLVRLVRGLGFRQKWSLGFINKGLRELHIQSLGFIRGRVIKKIRLMAILVPLV
uniref:Uncharacterized protein n=1 Tax=Tanacetum cinerariifolium TaxID=118510 RepID=A0A6L2P3F3_TANCI|nr:hypothetical protein [Tanacetum cinerariifolium]